MKDTKKEKVDLRRYLDDVYTREEASQVLHTFRDLGHGEWVEELASDVWEESRDYQSITDLEREKYKKEARQLLKYIAHRKRTLFLRIAAVAAGVAAVVCVLLGSINYLNYIAEHKVIFAELATSFGEKKQITLPDGTLLVLNSCSQIRYPNRFTGNVRRVELKGEGFFRVARNEDMPFVVNTGHFDVRVLGTRFDVRAYPTDEIVSVSVESGRVQVDLPEAMMRLGSREQLVINTLSGEYSKRKEERDVAVWRKGSLCFSSTPILDVAKELERVYNCRITFTSGQEFKNLISGEHDNKSLESVLQSIEYISDIKYKKEGRNVLLYK